MGLIPGLSPDEPIAIKCPKCGGRASVAGGEGIRAYCQRVCGWFRYDYVKNMWYSFFNTSVKESCMKYVGLPSYWDYTTRKERYVYYGGVIGEWQDGYMPKCNPSASYFPTNTNTITTPSKEVIEPKPITKRE